MSMTTVVCIVDYDNFYQDHGDGHRSLLENELTRMTRLAVEVDPVVHRVEIRLYGGWYQDGLLTQKASEVQEHISAIDLFPQRHPSGNGRLHGNVELVTRLTALPEVTWDRTLKQVQGLQRLRVETSSLPDTCSRHRDHCPIKILHRFAKEKRKICSVAGCTQRNADAFIGRQQKMVDAMMVCDIIELADHDHITGILTFTDDVDILPGLAVARPRKGATTLKVVFKNSRLNQKYEPFLDRIGIEHTAWEQVDA